MGTTEEQVKRLKELRNEKGLTQQELAHKSGVVQSHISMLERGERGSRLSVTVAVKLADSLGVSVQELMEEEGCTE